MTRDTYILIAFCVFMLLLGMRIRQRWQRKKENRQPDVKINKNQRPKFAQENVAEPPEVKARRERREKRVRLYTGIQLVVLLGLMIYMVPALVHDIAVPARIEPENFFLRCLIFLLTIYIFILGYIKMFRRKKSENQQ
ncbi:MAG: hypothetical protein LBM07_08835 [Culturomica sp.]|jgi:hypothetical protein|nr:hypothetical protein [Culturomica sp.]